MALAVSNTGLVDRMVRASRLDKALYNEVESDTSATQQALLVVVIVSLAAGIGAAISQALGGLGTTAIFGGLIWGIVGSLIAWAFSSFLMYFVGTRLFGGTATYGELLRTLGFASAPGVLAAFSFIPFAGGVLLFITWIWTIVTSFIAIREALDFSNGKTVATIVVGFIVRVVFFMILAALGLGAAADDGVVPLVDPKSEFGSRVARRLRDELVIWLVTVNPRGTPQPSLVWFLHDADEVLIYSKPGTPKVRNIELNPRVAVNLDSDKRGGDMIVIEGEARIVPDAPAADAVAEYVAKYRARISGIGMDPASFANAYSVAIRVRPLRLRGH